MPATKLLTIMATNGHGGCEYNVLSTTKYLRDAYGFDISIALPESQDVEFLRHLCRSNQIRTVDCGFEFKVSDVPERVSRHRSEIRALLEIEAPDAVFVALPWPKRGQGIVLGCADARVPCLVKFALVPPSWAAEDYVAPELQEAGARSQHWFANSRYSAALLEKHWKLPAHSVDSFHVGPIGLRYLLPTQLDAPSKATLRSELGLDRNAFVITTVARYTSQKGYRFLMEAVASIRARRRDIVFVWVGGGEQHRDLVEWVDARRLGRYVKVLGFRTDVRSILSQSDLFVLPTLYEGGCSQALLEAMEEALPIVATDTSAVAEVVTSGVSALLVAPGRSDELASAVVRLASDTHLRRALGDRARRAAARFSAEICFENTFQRLDAVLRG